MLSEQLLNLNLATQQRTLHGVCDEDMRNYGRRQMRNLKLLELFILDFFKPRHLSAQALLARSEWESQKCHTGTHLLALHEFQQSMRSNNGIEFPSVFVNITMTAAQE